MQRRQATPEDIPFLLDLRQRTMNVHVLASGGQVSDAHHMARLMHRFECAEILLHEGAPVGLLKVSRDPHEWVVIQIQLAPATRAAASAPACWPKSSTRPRAPASTSRSAC